jgi:hypothetical protein
MRNGPTSMKHFYRWLALSSAGMFSKCTAESDRVSGLYSVLASACPKAEGELLVFHRPSVRRVG